MRNRNYKVQSQIATRACKQINNEVLEQTRYHVSVETLIKVQNQVWNQIWIQTWNRVSDRVRRQIWDHSWDQVEEIK